MAVEPTKFTAIPKYIKIAIEILDVTKDDDSTVTEVFKIYTKGPGCPVPIVIETDNIYADYEENYPNEGQRKELNTDRYLAAARRANLLMYRDMLVAISEPNIPMDAANSLANDEVHQAGLKILQLAGWREEIAPIAKTEGDKTEGEVLKVDDETGVSTLPILTPSIQE